MYSNGLQDEELQNLHGLLGLNLNMFLDDILSSDLFKVEESGDRYLIYPLFYCDSIESDGDAFITGRYMISCRKDYEQIFLFISDSSIIVSKTYTIKNIENNTWIIFVYDEWTFQPLRNTFFTVDYLNGMTQTYQTDRLGYCTFNALNNNFEVIL